MEKTRRKEYSTMVIIGKLRPQNDFVSDFYKFATMNPGGSNSDFHTNTDNPAAAACTT